MTPPLRSGLVVLAVPVIGACAGADPSGGLAAPDARPDDRGVVRDVGETRDVGERVEDLAALIDTEPDPAFHYAFEGAKFVPPDGKTLLILGQTLGGIDEHVASFPDQPLPGGWAAYWGIPSMDGVDSEFLSDTGGRQNHQDLIGRFPNTVIQSGLWMVGTWDVAKKAGDGEYDEIVRRFSAWVKSVDRPFYLRIGYEFDGAHNELEPDEYVRAYRRIVDLMRAEGVENVAFVWHSYAAPPYKDYALMDWYPGDDYVDWFAISLFGHSYAPSPPRYVDAVFQLARERKKPMMVAESSPTNGIPPRGTGAWHTWFVNYFSLVYQRNIKAISFINEDWTRFNFPGLNWRDARLQNNPTIADAFFEETNGDRYLRQSPDLFEQLGYPADSRTP